MLRIYLSNSINRRYNVSALPHNKAVSKILFKARLYTFTIRGMHVITSDTPFGYLSKIGQVSTLNIYSGSVLRYVSAGKYLRYYLGFGYLTPNTGGYINRVLNPKVSNHGLVGVQDANSCRRGCRRIDRPRISGDGS
jgi:hypothetical protein